jgi:hypothetical protein
MADEMLWFDFDDVPPVGLRYRYRKRFLTLVGAMPYRRTDGVKSFILHWRDDAGARATSGLKAKDVHWIKDAPTPTDGGRA